MTAAKLPEQSFSHTEPGAVDVNSSPTHQQDRAAALREHVWLETVCHA
jgi:hypothetical protein